MSYAFRKGWRYRMPTHFGPAPGPRQRLDGSGYDCALTPRQTIVRAGFEAHPAQLAAYLPPGFTLREQAALWLTFAYLTEVDWLAGRGYNTFGASIPVSFHGRDGRVDGELLLVLWENMADPIITGREELGFSKVYCELPALQLNESIALCRASWDGCEFASMELSGLRRQSPERLLQAPASDGLLHYKYMPRTGEPGQADVEQVVLTPPATPNLKVTEAWVASTAVAGFRTSTWEELPTLVHIVNALAGLSLGPCTDAVVLKTEGAKDLSDQRVIF